MNETYKVLENHGAQQIRETQTEESFWYDFIYKGQSYSLEQYFDNLDEAYLSYFNWKVDKTVVGNFKSIINLLFNDN